MCNLVILTPQDSIELAEYTGLDSLQKGVGGYIECLCFKNFDIDTEVITVSLFCNEEFRIDHAGEFCHINAYATLLSGMPVYGNVVIAGVSGEDNFGFNEKQTESIKKGLNALFRKGKNTIRVLHEQGDTVI